MYTKTQLFIITYLLSSFGLALPINSTADRTNIEVTEPSLDQISRNIETSGSTEGKALEAINDLEHTYSIKDVHISARGKGQRLDKVCGQGCIDSAASKASQVCGFTHKY